MRENVVKLKYHCSLFVSGALNEKLLHFHAVYSKGMGVRPESCNCIFCALACIPHDGNVILFISNAPVG